MRFAALGDSITLGMGDPMPDGSWRGWAALLAEALGAEFHNLAVSGAQVSDVEECQVPRAVALRPDVAAMVVGVNDTLRATFDVARIGAALDDGVAALRGAGAVVLTMRLPDPGLMFGLPGAFARPLARRIRALNAVADIVATRHGTLHFDAAGHPFTYDRRMWSVDRLHPSERGHRLVAGAYADLLAASDIPVVRRPSAEPENPPPSRHARVRWLATKGVGWLRARATDLVPYLVGMAIRELWQGDRCDDELHREQVVGRRPSPDSRTCDLHGMQEVAGLGGRGIQETAASAARRRPGCRKSRDQHVVDTARL